MWVGDKQDGFMTDNKLWSPALKYPNSLTQLCLLIAKAQQMLLDNGTQLGTNIWTNSCIFQCGKYIYSNPLELEMLISLGREASLFL